MHGTAAIRARPISTRHASRGPPPRQPVGPLRNGIVGRCRRPRGRPVRSTGDWESTALTITVVGACATALYSIAGAASRASETSKTAVRFSEDDNFMWAVVGVISVVPWFSPLVRICLAARRK